MALRVMGRTGEEGARTLVHAASTGEEMHGRSLTECLVKAESNFVRSEGGGRIQERLGRELRGGEGGGEGGGDGVGTSVVQK